MSAIVLNQVGKTYGINPPKCASHVRARRMRQGIVIGPIAEVILDGKSVERRYNSLVDAQVTEPKVAWIMANATAPLAIELVASVELTTAQFGLMLMVAFSNIKDERAYRAAEKSGVV